MAVAAYYTWDRLGRPLEPAIPILDFVKAMRAAFPRAAEANQFSWHADEAHYQADYPQDHTPFSVTGWPLASPQWWVFATDIMHRPDLGVDCDELFVYWLSEARSGRVPWLKYMIYKRKIYDVRNDWRSQDAVGHDTHIHLSARTDHQYTHLGNWSAVPEGEDMTPDQSRHFHFLIYRVKGLQDMTDPIVIPRSLALGINEPTSEPNRLAQAIRALESGEPGTGLSAEEIKAIVRDQLNVTHLQSD